MRAPNPAYPSRTRLPARRQEAPLFTAEFLPPIPGDFVQSGSNWAVYIARTQHPLYPKLQLVIWRLADGSWSHDALDPRQEVGEVIPFDSSEARVARLRDAFFGVPTSLWAARS